MNDEHAEMIRRVEQQILEGSFVPLSYKMLNQIHQVARIALVNQSEPSEEISGIIAELAEILVWIEKKARAMAPHVAACQQAVESVDEEMPDLLKMPEHQLFEGEFDLS